MLIIGPWLPALLALVQDGNQAGEPGTRPPTPSLVLPEGFTSDLVLAAPDVRWPSAVHCLDDGTLLVAEDPMDMIGPANQPIDRILQVGFRPREVVTRVFAEGLYAVFGIESMGEVVLVMNMPHLTRLVDTDGDGVADERAVVVRGLGPEPPGMEGGFNDHAVSGISLGLDGWLYVSVGDKGIPLATGSDGSQVSLRGGGVVRVRPDGSRLELVASGTRNHLDVVLDERGNMFTLDNTDDGLGWWTRLTHVVEDGYYGYPFDYRDYGEHPERMLPCLADFGSGAPAGGLQYDGASWPRAYRGSFFWCEWGRGAIRRFELEESGSTFALEHDEDFATGPEGLEFRPLDLCLSPDGRFLYVADWGHPGWQSDEVTGRVWRIRQTGDDPFQSRDWGGLAEPPTTAAGWIDELGDDLRRVRLRAQRELVSVGTQPVRSELARVLGSNRIERRRRHALWALAELGGDQARVAVEAALASLNEDTCIQALRALRLRARELPAAALALVDDTRPHVRREAIATVGRLGDGEAALRLVRRFPRENDPWVRFAIRAALRHIGARDPEAAFGARVLSWLYFTGSARSGGQDRDDELLFALEGVYSLAAVERLAWLAAGEGQDWTSGWAERLAPTRARALGILSRLHRRPEPWDGSWWSTQPARGEPPVKVLAWEGTEAVLAAVRRGLGDPAAQVRRAALEGLRETRDAEGAASCRARWFDEDRPELRLLALDVLAELGDADAVELVARIVREPGTTTEERDRAVATAARIATPSMQALLVDVVRADGLSEPSLAAATLALGRLGGSPSAAELLRERLGHPAPDLRAAALEGLVALEGPDAGESVLSAFEDEAVVVRRAAVRLAGELELRRAVPPLLALCTDPGVRAEVYRSLATLRDPEALDALLVGLGEAETLEASRLGLRALREEVLAELEARHRRGELQEPLLGTVRELVQEPVPVLDWLVAGPFPRGSGAPRFEGELFLRALDGEGADGDLADLADPRWLPHRAEPRAGFVDLDRLLSADLNLEAWATGSFELVRGGPLELALGSDDSMSVWIDGLPVHDFPGARAWGAGQDRVPLELEAGRHEVVLRIGQGVGDWAFSFATRRTREGPLFEDRGLSADPSSLEAYRDYALAGTGSITSGFRLFQNTRRFACLLCHSVTTASGPIGERVGPNLDGVGSRYDRAELIRSILEPSSRVASGYEAERIWTRDGRSFEGQVVSEGPARLLLVDASGVEHALAKADIEGRSTLRGSIMPEGYHALMTRQELTDLVTFLEQLEVGGPLEAEQPPERSPRGER